MAENPPYGPTAHILLKVGPVAGIGFHEAVSVRPVCPAYEVFWAASF